MAWELPRVEKYEKNRKTTKKKKPKKRPDHQIQKGNKEGVVLWKPRRGLH